MVRGLSPCVFTSSKLKISEISGQKDLKLGDKVRFAVKAGKTSSFNT